MILGWGKCGIETTTSTDGAPAGTTWTEIDTPKEDTTKLTPTEGTRVDATEEGGEIVDSRQSKPSYIFEFDLFVKKGGTRPWEDEDGIIDGEHAIRVWPKEDETCPGIQIDRCTLSCYDNYSTADGRLIHYSARVLKPKTGKMVKDYTKETA